MPIYPLPQFEADVQALEAEDRAIYERLKAPATVVVRFGATYMVGEFLYDQGVKPGCGTKMVVRTHRGVELGDMLTSTCPNSGCDKSISRKEMLEYIDNSGGRDYPFFQQGKVERIATAQDLAEQARLDEMKPHLARAANMLAQRLNLPMKVISAEPILGGEKLTFYFTSEQRVDFREMVSILAGEHRTRIEMRQVGARDEARLTADYERCGQHCCCKQFLKVLKPISMRAAKVQKATLDPLKISGRCGRLMCCLRYEDETYEDLRARLPRKKQRVKTEDGWGIVMDTQILTQLALVRLEPKPGASPDAEIVEIAVPVEELEWDGKVGPTRTRAEREDDQPDHDDDDFDRMPDKPTGGAPGSGAIPRREGSEKSDAGDRRQSPDRRGGDRRHAPPPFGGSGPSSAGGTPQGRGFQRGPAPRPTGGAGRPGSGPAVGAPGSQGGPGQSGVPGGEDRRFGGGERPPGSRPQQGGGNPPTMSGTSDAEMRGDDSEDDGVDQPLDGAASDLGGSSGEQTSGPPGSPSKRRRRRRRRGGGGGGGAGGDGGAVRDDGPSGPVGDVPTS